MRILRFSLPFRFFAATYDRTNGGALGASLSVNSFGFKNASCHVETIFRVLVCKCLDGQEEAIVVVVTWCCALSSACSFVLPLRGNTAFHLSSRLREDLDAEFDLGIGPRVFQSC